MKGAFTGADKDKVGKFEAADGGTLFLDEIGEMRKDLQVKLLKALDIDQDGKLTITKVGSIKEQKVDVRIIAATNINLFQAVHDGGFDGSRGAVQGYQAGSATGAAKRCSDRG